MYRYVSSSASSFIGHTSMMAFDSWGSDWDSNGLAKMTVTAYAKDANAQWEGKTDGVQYEPIGLWAGNSESSVNKVRVFRVQNVKWVWNWFRSGFRYTPASDADYNKAVGYAYDQIGKPYNWSFIKYLDSSFYCSSLVYKSWNNVSSGYNMSSILFFVTPAEIAFSNKTVCLASFSNK